MSHDEDVYALRIQDKIQEVDVVVNYLSCVDSTNTCLKKMAIDNAPDKTVLVAECQTNGRGRFERVFYSPAQSGIYMSILMRNVSLQQASRYTICAAVAVVRMLKQMAHVSAQIKWVNDIYLDGKKVCGILTESLYGLTGGNAAVVGIGVNLNVEEFPEELRDKAATISIDKDKKPACIACLIDCFFQAVQEDFMNVLEEYRSLSILMHKEIDFQYQGELLHGVVQDINESGNLVVSVQGKEMILTSGEVTMHGLL